jgi:hypothetical protein
MPPAISSTMVAQRDAHRHLDQPGVASEPARAKTLVPGLSGGADRDANPPAPSPMIAGTLASVSTLLIIVGAPHSPARSGTGAAATGCRAALDRGHQRGLLAADEGAGTDPDLDVERERRAEHAAAEQLGRLAARMARSSRSIASGYSART